MNDDLISRKAAIDEVKRLHDVAWANWKETRISANTMIDALKDLPSAQPEPTLEQIEEYCHKRCLSIVDNALLHKYAQAETAKRIVGKSKDGMTLWYQCDMCNEPVDAQDNFCRGCGRRLVNE
jgi:hypothetical protein